MDRNSESEPSKSQQEQPDSEKQKPVNWSRRSFLGMVGKVVGITAAIGIAKILTPKETSESVLWRVTNPEGTPVNLEGTPQAGPLPEGQQRAVASAKATRAAEVSTPTSASNSSSSTK